MKFMETGWERGWDSSGSGQDLLAGCCEMNLQVPQKAGFLITRVSVFVSMHAEDYLHVAANTN